MLLSDDTFGGFLDVRSEKGFKYGQRIPAFDLQVKTGVSGLLADPDSRAGILISIHWRPSQLLGQGRRFSTPTMSRRERCFLHRFLDRAREDLNMDDQVAKVCGFNLNGGSFR